MLGYLSSKLSIFLELSSLKSVLFLVQTKSADKCPSIFSCQMDTIYAAVGHGLLAALHPKQQQVDVNRVQVFSNYALYTVD